MADETCPICKFPFRYEDDIESSFRRCSEFCAAVNEKELNEFKAAKPGDYCCYPCPGCGIVMEDVWCPDNPQGIRCSKCARKAELQELRDVLTAALPHLPAELRVRAEEALKA